MKKPTSRDRGEFRSFFTAIIDDPAFPELDDFAFKLLFALKMSLSAVGIGVLRIGTLIDCLACTKEQLERGLQILEAPKPGSAVGWIKRDRKIAWIINGLHFETSLYPNNPKHRSFVARSLKALGDASIVAEFQAYYREWFEGVSEGYPNGIGTPSDHREGDRDSTRTTTDTAHPSGARDSLPDEFQSDFDQLIDRIPERSRPAWSAEISSAPRTTVRQAGINVAPTPAQVGRAIRDYNANGEAPNLAHFRGYLRRSTAEPRGGSVRSGKRSGPRDYDYTKPTDHVEDVKWQTTPSR